jgi:chaperonin GroES
MNLKPIKDQVLIKEIKKEEKTKSGIILPDTAEKQGPAQGEVVAVGEGKNEDGQNIPLSVKV